MTTFLPKIYQQSVLDSVETYFRACLQLGDADTAFYQTTRALWGAGSKYQPIAGFSSDMPYFCLRVPTGGGKTWLAAKSVALINTHLLRCEHSVILWLVPSKAIREQTLQALRNPQHPYHCALREAGPLTVLELDEAKNVTRATLDTSTTVIVATVQAFRREDTDWLKVYQSSGALMHHFEHLTAEQRAELLNGRGEVNKPDAHPAHPLSPTLSRSAGEGANESLREFDYNDGETTPYSLANVLRLRRPFVIVDEAHNNRTPLSFKTFADFRPSGILELTATPDTEQTPSNVLHSVSAAELKSEEMIKLPIMLETEPNWQQCLADALARRGELQTLSDQEARQGAAYLRPLVLIQAEKRRKGIETLDVDRIKHELIENHRVPPEEIIIATGEERGLEKVDADYLRGIADAVCPVKYVITQQALAEGWDCPSAYILVSMAELHSATSVEQLLGRVLRQPDARRRVSQPLNQSYAFVVSRNFADTAAALRDRLVQGAGFDRHAAAEFVQAVNPQQRPLDIDGERVVIHPVVVALPEKPDLKSIPKAVRDKLSWDDQAKELTISQPLCEAEQQHVEQAVQSDHAKAAIVQAAIASRTTAVEFFQTPAELGTRFLIPQVALAMQGEFVLFDDPEVLEYPWDLSRYDAAPTAKNLAELNAALKVSEGGEIDVDDTGRMTARFIADMQHDLGLAYRPENWNEVRLAAWLCHNLPEQSITHASKQAFVAHWVSELLAKPGYDLGRANRQKFLIRNLLEQRVRMLRIAAIKQAYQQTLFGAENENRVSVDERHCFEYHPQGYAPSRDYDGRFGQFTFRKHYYGRIGDFDSGEEFACACWLDTQAQKGRINFWVRNLVRKEGCSFFLQKADGRFYPDFLCQLPDGTILVVEYKGADRWKEAEDDRMIGGLWAELSGVRCRFVMVKNREWGVIDAEISKAAAINKAMSQLRVEFD